MPSESHRYRSRHQRALDHHRFVLNSRRAGYILQICACNLEQVWGTSVAGGESPLRSREVYADALAFNRHGAIERSFARGGRLLVDFRQCERCQTFSRDLLVEGVDVIDLGRWNRVVDDRESCGWNTLPESALDFPETREFERVDRRILQGTDRLFRVLERSQLDEEEREIPLVPEIAPCRNVTLQEVGILRSLATLEVALSLVPDCASDAEGGARLDHGLKEATAG